MSLRADLGAVARLQDRVSRLAGIDTRGLADALGAEVESQTKRRISSERTGPDGERWPAWSPSYAATRHAGHSLLMGEGDFQDSIQYVLSVAGDGAEVGTNLVQAAAHQFGLDMSILSTRRRVTIPARPYLGISDENAADLESVTDAWVDAQLDEVLQ